MKRTGLEPLPAEVRARLDAVVQGGPLEREALEVVVRAALAGDDDALAWLQGEGHTVLDADGRPHFVYYDPPGNQPRKEQDS